MSKPLAVIIGVGGGLSASLARKLSLDGFRLALAARHPAKLAPLAEETSASLIACDVAVPADVELMFAQLEGPLRLLVYNPSSKQRAPFAELDPASVKQALDVTAFGAFLSAQQAVQMMLRQEKDNGTRGTILFTGASAGCEGFAFSAPFAMGKFAQRGLAQSMSRELHRKAIHVAWINIDGTIRRQDGSNQKNNDDSTLDPDKVADAYLSLLYQHRSCWSSEITIRPWVEDF